MYIKSLEIQGFKSFPEKTVLNFGEDITAIVGPNGSGKSNISDAIRWVMGEQNSRQLRGGKMEDVIFGGTEKRNQTGFAQVSLVIDNTEHIFPSREEAEVAITRRYYRSGESEYYINRQSVRLKDVNELFMDTGMGREGYSIIGQGKIDEILSVKSGERREIFEEAAGISKFRHRKEESERKLQKTEENLVRIRDKISELELQVEPLREQSAKAQKYLVLRDELRVLEISVWLENLQTLKTTALKLQSDYETAKQDQEKAQQDLARIRMESDACSEQVQANDIAAEQLREQMSQLDGQINQEESRIMVLRSTMDHNRETLEQIDRELSSTQTRAEDLQGRMDALAERMAGIDQQSAQLDEELEQLLVQVRAIAESAGSAAQEAEALRAREALATAAAADARAQLSALTAGAREVADREAALQAELSANRQNMAEKEQEAAANRRELESAREEEQAAANIIQGHSLKMEGRQRRAEEAAARKMQLTADEKNLSGRIHVLREMEKEYEGFSRAVKVVMQAAEHNTLRGIHGPVANLMHTEEQYSVAIEIALGGNMQNIVVDREEDAKAAIGLLKQRDAGRGTFLPLTTIRGDELKEQGLDDEYGFVGVASRLVQYDKKYEAIARYALGHTVIVEDLDCGIQMARRHQNRFRIVTLDGQVINRGGSMTGGSVNRNSGVLSRAGEIVRRRAELEQLQQQLAEANARAEETGRELQKAQYELDVAKEQQNAAAQQVSGLAARQDHYDILLESLRFAGQNMEAELESLQRRKESDAQQSAQVSEIIRQHEQEAQRLQEQLQQQQEGQTDLQNRSGELAEQMTRKREAQAALAAEKESALRSLQDLEAMQTDMRNDHTDREERARQIRLSNEQAQLQVDDHRQKADGLRGQLEQLRSQLSMLMEEKMALEARRSSMGQESDSCYETLRGVDGEVSRLDNHLSKNAMEQSQILDRLWETYELSHSDAQAQRIELESIPKATRRIAELTRERKSLGNVNLDAIEEFQRVNSRYTMFVEQQNDVEQAKEALQGVIDEITKEMTEIFAEQFKLLNESFQETFLELFGGGKARLELEDETDILNCGIEIKVQPPGKQLKTITLLSGGEKAFVAIALYFAILKVHPTPFCVMDEIEAALDEANVVRYAKYMRRIAGKTQFIVITHRRGTMEEADVLYGVTMQERGVSKVLTINLNDMAKELRIK
ncbi:MAG: chromosome segregation protein SMC [Ruminococcaceae bacterium]|nr:chromosome segregation protein SMC [Oscillospiraceae bacterium]